MPVYDAINKNTTNLLRADWLYAVQLGQLSCVAINTPLEILLRKVAGKLCWDDAVAAPCNVAHSGVRWSVRDMCRYARYDVLEITDLTAIDRSYTVHSVSVVVTLCR